MKELIAGLLIGSFGCFTSYAGVDGLPAEDPVVRHIRNKFIKANDTVQLEALKEGALGRCKSYNATEGNFERSIAAFTLIEQFDGLWEGRVNYSDPGELPYRTLNMTFIRGEKGTLHGIYNGKIKGKTFELYSREDDDNIYLEEVPTFERKWNEANRAYGCFVTNTVNSISVGNSCHPVTQYIVCPKNKKD